MKIFLDTNTFYNDWFLKSANFKYLFNWINSIGHTIILSELVIQESDNIFQREQLAAWSDFRKNIKQLGKFNKSKIDFLNEPIENKHYSLKSEIAQKTTEFKIFGYSNISHETVVQKALKNKRPFLEGEKGYRDTLIWLSFLNYIEKSHENDDVIFITHNKSDFFKKTTNDELLFHSDLQDDIGKISLPVKIIPFSSLAKFIESTIDKDIHALDHYKTEELFGEFIEELSTTHFELMDRCELFENLRIQSLLPIIQEIKSVRFEIFEGIEDPHLISSNKLNGDDIYVSYSYNLRRSIVSIEITQENYLSHKSDFDKNSHNIEISEGNVMLIFYIRPYFEVSFIYNEKTVDFKDSAVSNLFIRI